MKKSLILLITGIFAIIAGCAEEDGGTITIASSEDKRSEVVASSMIDIPSSISSSSSSSSTQGLHSQSLKVRSSAPSTEDEPVWAVYEGIRDNIGALERWTSLIEQLTEMIYTVVGTVDSGDWTNTSGDADEPGRIVWGSGSDQGYDHKMELYFSGTKGFEAYLTVNESAETAKGVFTWDFSLVPNSESSSANPKIQFIFDSTVSPKSMTIKVTSMFGYEANGPKNAWVEVTQSDDHVINLWGNYYFENLYVFGGDTTGDSAESRNYVFAASGYDETGQTTDKTNKAVVRLALPLASTSTTTNIWTDDDVSSVFIEKIKQVWTNIGLTQTLIDNWTGYTTGASSISGYTEDNVIDILEYAATHSDATSDTIDDLVYVTKLVNNAYFNATGFYATCEDASSDGTCDQGTIASESVPSGYDGLDIDSVADDVESPSTVQNMTVDFL